MRFNKILKELRLEQGLTQIQLAKKSNLAPSCIAMFETEKREPNANSLIALSAALSVSTDYLLGLEDDFGTRTPAPPSFTDLQSEKLSEKEKALLEAFNKLLPETQDFILRTAQSLSDKEIGRAHV